MLFGTLEGVLLMKLKPVAQMKNFEVIVDLCVKRRREGRRRLDPSLRKFLLIIEALTPGLLLVTIFLQLQPCQLWRVSVERRRRW
jgi:hypothetical protein